MLLTQHGRLVRGAPPQCMIPIPIPGTDVHRRYDKLTRRLRAAEFTLNTLLARAEELRKIMSNELVPASTPTPEDHTPPSCEPPAPGTASHSNPESHETSLSDPLPTPLPTLDTDRSSAPFLPRSSLSTHSEPSFPSTDWTQRCIAYYAKRKLQEAKKARRAGHDNAPSRQSSSNGPNPHVRSQSYSSQGPPPSPSRSHTNAHGREVKCAKQQ